MEAVFKKKPETVFTMNSKTTTGFSEAKISAVW